MWRPTDEDLGSVSMKTLHVQLTAAFPDADLAARKPFIKARAWGSDSNQTSRMTAPLCTHCFWAGCCSLAGVENAARFGGLQPMGELSEQAWAALQHGVAGLLCIQAQTPVACRSTPESSECTVRPASACHCLHLR